MARRPLTVFLVSKTNAERILADQSPAFAILAILRVKYPGLTLYEKAAPNHSRLIPGSLISSARWQATKCPGLISRKSGGWVPQTSAAWAQRGWK